MGAAVGGAHDSAVPAAVTEGEVFGYTGPPAATRVIEDMLASPDLAGR